MSKQTEEKLHKAESEPQSRGGKQEKRDLRLYFLRLFEKYDLRNEKQFVLLGKWLIFIVIAFMEILILFQHLSDFVNSGGLAVFLSIIIVEFLLPLSEVLKLFVVKKEKSKLVFYILDMMLASSFLFVTVGAYSLIIYMLVLTEFYLVNDKTRTSVLLLAISMLLYVGSYGVRVYLNTGEEMSLLVLIPQSVGSLFALVVHFLIAQVALAFYRQFLRLDKAMKELAESKKELEKAYEVVAEVSALEERQRIAKEIHDTAGHSLTTVIMQTEAAKLILPSNPEEASRKMIAANLQAKNALEELRNSVHLLSGIKENQTLKSALEDIIHESTDGTDITIRSQIEDVEVSPAKHRFLCNTLKEGISNGLRHGGATAFWFELKKENGNICFLLSDNGKGVDVNALTFGFGLTSMKDRAKSLGGEVRVESEVGEGFELYLTLTATDVHERE